MFFLLRCAFWIGLVFIVAPMITGTGSVPSVPDAASVVDSLRPTLPATATAPAAGTLAGVAAGGSAMLADGAATIETVSDVARFCIDNAAVCTAGLGALDLLGEAVGQGIGYVALMTGAEEPAAAGAPLEMRGTLTSDDVAVPWHGTGAPVVAGSQARLRLPPPDPRRAAPQG